MKSCFTFGVLFYLFTHHASAQTLFAATLHKVLVNHAPDSQFWKKDIVHLKALDDDILIEFINKDNKSILGDSFRFVLEGYDKEWTTTAFPIARYTSLKGGDYIFKAQWSGNDTIFIKRIQVERALSEEPWFYPSVISSILLILGAIFYFWSIYNLRQKLKVQTIRNHIASDLHDEVGATLSSVAISVRTVQRKLHNTPELVDVLEKVRLLSEETNHNLRDTVWTINPENDTFDKVIDRMRAFAFQILMAQEIQLDFENNVDTTKPFKISMEQRRNVYLMFKEAVNNIARHSEATKASVKLTQEKDGIRLTIEDNGKGFEMGDKYDGNGLKNFRRRAAESFINLDVKSTPIHAGSVSDASKTSGTTITMLIPEL